MSSPRRYKKDVFRASRGFVSDLVEDDGDDDGDDDDDEDDDERDKALGSFG